MGEQVHVFRMAPGEALLAGRDLDAEIVVLCVRCYLSFQLRATVKNLGRQSAGEAPAGTFQQTIAFEAWEIVAELVEPIVFFGEPKRVERGLVDRAGSPAAEQVTAMEQNLKRADQPGIIDLDPGIPDRADLDWPRHALEQEEVDVDVEPLRLVSEEAIR